MAFDYIKYLRNNRLLKENFGGYVDLQPINNPLREEAGIEEGPNPPAEDDIYSKPENNQDKDDDYYGNRMWDLVGNDLDRVVKTLNDDGYFYEDIAQFLRDLAETVDDMADSPPVVKKLATSRAKSGTISHGGTDTFAGRGEMDAPTSI